MKLSAKPISSPGRAEKYPPPLMRFLRSNVGSRSRGRSRTSPMFIRKKNTASIETQEPTSPKVTCMGQVRVRRSKQQSKSLRGRGEGDDKQPKNRRRHHQNNHQYCQWIQNTLFCPNFNGGKLKPKCFNPSWPKWVPLFHVSFRRKSKIREESSRSDLKLSNRSEDIESEEEEEDDDEEEEANNVFVSTTITPPKNALLLTRCRSAPYRSSSLAGRFWGSPLDGEEETEQKQSTLSKETEDKEEEEDENLCPASKSESLCKESDPESRLDRENEEKIGHFEGPITAITVKNINSEKIKEFKTEVVGGDGGTVMHPLILTRCKSEPARIGEKLDPEMSYWKKRRLGFT